MVLGWYVALGYRLLGGLSFTWLKTAALSSHQDYIPANSEEEEEGRGGEEVNWSLGLLPGHFLEASFAKSPHIPLART